MQQQQQKKHLPAQVMQQLEIQKNIKNRKIKNMEWISTNLSSFPMLSTMPTTLINDICFNFPLLYTFIKRINYTKIQQIKENKIKEIKLSDLMTRDLSREYLANILKFFDPSLALNIIKLSKHEMFCILCDLIHQKCCLENFFIQDIFHPGSIFKEKYKYDSYTDLFITAFYYILNCEFRSDRFPLKLNHNKPKFRFPMDVNPDEFERPCVIVDVANQFNRIGDYRSRVHYLKTNIYMILDKLIKKHNDPNLLVMFVHQGDRSKNYNCPEIIDILVWQNDARITSLLRGTSTSPFDRHVLYITIPCHLFLEPELDYPGDTRVVRRNFSFNIGGNEPGYPRGAPLGYLEQVKNTVYDKYGRMLYLPENGDVDYGTRFQPHNYMSYYGRPEFKNSKIPYYAYNLLDEKLANIRRPPFKKQTSAIPHTTRHSTTQTFQGENRFEHFVKPVNECSSHRTICKNEIDDYMVGILLYVHFKIQRECRDFSPYRPRWLLFTHDNYRWMNQDVLQSKFIIKKDDFLSYIDASGVSLKKDALLVPNPFTKRMIQQLDLNRYKINYYQFIDLLQNIIRINKIK